jgi:hypothetical protein
LSQVHLLTLQPSGHLLLAFNNHNHAGAGNAHCKACRTLLELAVSTDDGFTWQRAGVVDDEVGMGVRVHYPTMQQVRRHHCLQPSPLAMHTPGRTLTGRSWRGKEPVCSPFIYPEP